MLRNTAQRASYYLAAGHILLSTAGRVTGILDNVPAHSGLSRRVAVTVPSFTAAALYAASSDLVDTLPDTAARRAAEQAGW